MFKLENFNKKNIFIFFIISTLTFLLVQLFSYHYRVVTFPFQLEYRESAPLLIIDAINKGVLPYNINALPYYSDLYGIVHPLLTYPFTFFLGNNLITFKLVSMICIFFSCFILFRSLKKISNSYVIAITLSILYYGLSLFQYTPICRADALGLLFFTISIILPFIKNFSFRSLLISGICSILAFHTKIYFFIGFPIIVSYIFLFISVKKAFKITLIYFIVFFIIFITISFFFDYYYIGTFHNQLASSSYEIIHMLRQTNYYFLITIPIITFIVIYLSIRFLILNGNKILSFFTINPDRIDLTNHFNIKNLEKGFLPSISISYWVYLFTLFLGVLTFKMGGHNGNFLLYYIHLLSIPLIFITNNFLISFKKINIATICLLIFNISLIIKILPITIDEKKSLIQYEKIKKIISNSKSLLSNPVIGSIALNENRKILNSGLTETFVIGDEFRYSGNLPKPLAMIKDKIFLNTINKVKPKNETYLKLINDQLKKHEFDVIFTDTSIYDDWIVNQKQLFKYGYTPTDTFDIGMFASYQNWRLVCWKIKQK